MIARGYQTSSTEKKYTAEMVARFKLRNTWTKRMKRIKDNGLSHVLMGKLVRALNWKFLNSRMENAEAAKHRQRLVRLEKNC